MNPALGLRARVVRVDRRIHKGLKINFQALNKMLCYTLLGSLVLGIYQAMNKFTLLHIVEELSFSEAGFAKYGQSFPRERLHERSQTVVMLASLLTSGCEYDNSHEAV